MGDNRAAGGGREVSGLGRSFALVLVLALAWSGVSRRLPEAAAGQPVAPDDGRWVGAVADVVDGDTLVVGRDGEPVRVRLHGIDCPEGSQPGGREATALATELVAGRQVTVVPTDTDRYGRTVAWVMLPRPDDADSLNHRLVAEGYAWWYRQYASDDASLEEAERTARTKRRGLWGQKPAPTAPWLWRSGEREPTDVNALE